MVFSKYCVFEYWKTIPTLITAKYLILFSSVVNFIRSAMVTLNSNWISYLYKVAYNKSVLETFLKILDMLSHTPQYFLYYGIII